ncbi:biotin transport system substrate-specific component [Desulfobaculum xiamenense]|uniref:Biotin transporter n=1 Tax=Desulfobaculum xiamenense TaxID=995050 RepID=A0A846QM52_9BACT|nr:biotin transporter BioY [Desulfobaculum xiamenense]NJB68110.1 biotin transport system substrate-specific component [Desulfobaculum xiamenense]
MNAPDEFGTLESLHKLVWTAMLAATISIGAYLHFPIGPVPFSMQPFFVFLAGYILGPVHGAFCVALYIGAGAIGLPVFAGGNAGFAYLLGPTGGYLAGFAAAATLCGMTTRNGDTPQWLPGLAWGALALAATYGIGAWRLAAALDMPWAKAIAIGVAPFILPDAVKIVAALACARFMRQRGLLRL